MESARRFTFEQVVWRLDSRGRGAAQPQSPCPRTIFAGWNLARLPPPRNLRHLPNMLAYSRDRRRKLGGLCEMRRWTPRCSVRIGAARANPRRQTQWNLQMVTPRRTAFWSVLLGVLIV